MTINALGASNAYRNQLKMQQDITDSAGDSQSSPASPFLDMVKSLAEETISTQKNAEAVQMQSMAGKVELSDLVTAISAADLTLNTVVAVRDRVINAYQDIIRMPI